MTDPHRNVQPAKATKKWPWILLALSVVVGVGFVGFAVLANKGVDKAPKPVSIGYEVTGDAKGVEIIYSRFDGGDVSSVTEQNVQLPWKKDVRAEGLDNGGSLTVIADDQGGTVTCRVTLDGREARRSVATGPFAVASCTGF